MAARVFEDSAGVSWEVFEVHRATQASRGVSAGLESGWLAFVSAEGKRRLAPFPADWEQAAPQALEELCASARPAVVSPQRPRVVKASREPLADDDAPSAVREKVREFAREARANRLPAIEAMMRLRATLALEFPSDGASAEHRAEVLDRRRIRRWFVEAFYFERRD